MIRSAASKLVWVGRTTAIAMGLAVALALVLGVATMALAAVPGDPFKLGKLNTINAITQLVGSRDGAMLRIDNNSSGANAHGLNLEVNEGKAPLRANAAAGTATGLSADELDGKSSEQFANGVGGKATDADKLDGKEASDFYAQGSKVADSSHADQADSAATAQNADKLGGAQAGDYQRKCQKGSVTGHVVVDDPSTLTNSWTDANNKYISSYNCTGEPIRIYRYGPGRYAVEFDGQEYMGRTAVASVENGYGRDDAFASTSFVFHFGDGRIARYVDIRTYDGTYVDSSFQLVAFD